MMSMDSGSCRVLRRFALVLLSAVCLTAACRQPASFEQMIPQEDVAFAKQLVATLREREYETIEAVLDPEVTAAQAQRPMLESMASLFPPGEAIDVRVIGAQVTQFNQQRTVVLVLEYRFPGKKWVVANVMLQQAGGRQLVRGFQATPASDSQAVLNRFTLAGKGPAHYLMLVVTAVVPLVTVGTFLLVLYSPIQQRKWLWAVMVLFGVGQISFNWTTGEFAFQALAVQVLGGAYMQAGPFAPVVLITSIPAAAMVFLLGRRSLIARQAGAARTTDAV